MNHCELHANPIHDENSETFAVGFVTPDFGEDTLLYSEHDLTTLGAAAASLQIKQVVTGIRSFNLRGSRWHNFQFSVNLGVAVKRAVCSIALLGIHNRNTANNLDYNFQNVRVTYSANRKTAYVSGRVKVGDSDGYLRQLSFHLTAI